MEIDTQRVTDLVGQIDAMERSGAAKPGHPDHWRRTEVMDELQDAVGLAGKMVTDADILRRAQKIIAGG